MATPSSSGSRTSRAVLFGLAIGSLLAAANVYAGLQLAFVDAGSTVVVLVAFALFGRGAFTPDDAAVTVAAASSAAVMAVTAGLIGPIPALALAGHDVSTLAVITWAIALGLLGTILAIPFRDSLIAVRKLAFPSAHATGMLIRALFVERDRARSSLRILVLAGMVAAVIVVLRDAVSVVPSSWLLPIAIAGVPAAQLSIGIAASPLLVGVGYLAGIRTATSMLLGTVIAWLVIAPAVVTKGLATPSYPSVVSWTLWPGAALLVASSLTSFIAGGDSLWRAVRGDLRVVASRYVGLGVVGLAAIVVASGTIVFSVHPALTVLAVILAAGFGVAAMHTTGETDNTPSGPLGGLTQMIVGPLGSGPAAPLHAGGVVNGVATHAATMLNAWKTGDLVEASRSRILRAQLAGIIAGAIAAVIAYEVIRRAYGIATTAMPAPGVVSWKATADAASSGTSTMPPGAPLAAAIAAMCGIALVLANRAPRVARWLPSPVAVGIGFVLPASLTAAFTVGAIVAFALHHRAAAWHDRHGAALASGLIVGESLTGVVVAAIVVVRQLG